MHSTQQTDYKKFRLETNIMYLQLDNHVKMFQLYKLIYLRDPENTSKSDYKQYFKLKFEELNYANTTIQNVFNYIIDYMRFTSKSELINESKEDILSIQQEAEQLKTKLIEVIKLTKFKMSNGNRFLLDGFTNIFII